VERLDQLMEGPKKEFNRLYGGGGSCPFIPWHLPVRNASTCNVC
jgi:hypothetical protein